MRIAFFSDAHGNEWTMQAFIEALQKANVDEVVFCGDLVGYYYNPIKVWSAFKDLPLLRSVRGNHDQQLINVYDGKTSIEALCAQYGSSYQHALSQLGPAIINEIRSWPEQLKLSYDGVTVEVCHGSPSDFLHGRIYPDCSNESSFANCSSDILVLGHTHYRMQKRVQHALVVNPGSLGQPRDGSSPGFMILTTPSKKVEYIDLSWDRDALVDQIKRFDPNRQDLIDVLYRTKMAEE